MATSAKMNQIERNIGEIIMKTKMIVICLIPALFLQTGCDNRENKLVKPKQEENGQLPKEAQGQNIATAYTNAQTKGTLSALQDFISQYPDSQQAKNAQQRVKEALSPDAIIWLNVSESMKAGGVCIYTGASVYRLSDDGPSEWVQPTPDTSSIVVVVMNDADFLISKLKKGKVFHWKGGGDILFLRNVDTTLSQEEISRVIGVKSFGFREIARIPPAFISPLTPFTTPQTPEDKQSQQAAGKLAESIVSLIKSGDMAGAKKMVDSIQDENLKNLVRLDVSIALKQ